MIDFLSNALISILRAIEFALDVAVSISRMQRFAQAITGSDKLIAVPADPKALPPAAQRAIAEAEARERMRDLTSGRRRDQTASGAVQAS